VIEPVRPALKLRRYFLRRLRPGSLQRDENGAAAIEFAVIAPIFFFLLFVIAETALVFIAEQVMDNALFETARLVRTGQVQKADMSDADFKSEVCKRMAVFVDCASSDFYMDVKSYNSFADLEMNKPLNADETFKDESAYQFGGEGQIVVVRAYYQWPTNKIFGSLSLANLSNGKRMIGSFAAFRNEPFGAGVQQASN
jgi:Flp pilus assembly protein TadG